MLFDELLRPFYKRAELDAFFSILSTPPSVTTLRVNTLKYTAEQAKALLEAHFQERKEPFQVELQSHLFPDLLVIPSVPFGSGIVAPAEKGKHGKCIN